MKVRPLGAAIGRLPLAARAGAIWLAVYSAVCWSGQDFDPRYLDYGWQLIPWDILSSDPWRSIWYLHVQPPLWNATLGIAAWLSPIGDATTVQVVMAAFGAAAAAGSAELARRLGASARSALVIGLVATLHPEVLKGAFEPTYELAVAALLVAVAIVAVGPTGDVATRRALDPRRRVVILALVLTAVAMTRSLYHPVWLAVVLTLALWTYRRHIGRRAVVTAVLVPLVVIGAWMGKNYVLYDRATVSSWFGMNLQRAVIPVLDLDDLDEMHERGLVSDVAMIGPFGKYALYADAVEPCRPSRAHRSLSEPTRTTDPWSPNFNYECYLPIFDRAGHDAWAVIREHPEVWLEGRLWSLRTTFAVSGTPPGSPSWLMRTLDRIYSIARLDLGGVLSTRGWGTPVFGRLEAPVDFGLLLIPMYGMVIVSGVTRIRRVLRSAERVDVLALGSVVIGWTVAFTVVIGAVAELGEQARFRTMTDPLTTVAAAVLVVDWVGRRRSRHRPHSVGGRQASDVGR